MAVKIMMFAFNLLIPAIMLIFAGVSKKHPPKTINGAIGYRTTMSMKNQETWDFAHELFAKLWWKWGWVIFIISLAISFACLFLSEKAMGIATVVVETVQLIALMLPIFTVEKALKKNFDRNGNRK